MASLLLALAVLGGGPAFAADPSGQVTNVVGTGSLVRVTVPEAQPVKFQDSVFTGDRIDTREQSVVRLLLGGKVTVTIRELSSLTITEEATRASVELHGGKVAVQVNPLLMKKGDAVHIYTPNAVAAIRGSLLVAEVGGADDTQESTITALEATIPIFVSSRAEPDRWQPLLPNQAISIRGRRQVARLGVVRGISGDEAGRQREALVLPGTDRRELRRPGEDGPGGRVLVPGGPRVQPGPGMTPGFRPGIVVIPDHGPRIGPRPRDTDDRPQVTRPRDKEEEHVDDRTRRPRPGPGPTVIPTQPKPSAPIRSAPPHSHSSPSPR